MTTPEKKVKARVRKVLREKGADLWHFMPAANGYGQSGIPDIVGVYYGGFFGIETKAGDNKPTALQLKAIREINEAGGYACVINEIDTEKKVLEMLAVVLAKHRMM